MADGDSFYATANDSIYRSLNAGKGWRRINRGLREIAIRSVVDIDGNGKKIIALGDYDSFRSINGGKNWQYIDELARYQKVEKHPHNSGLIFAFSYGTFAISRNAGTTWTFHLAPGDVFALDPKRENVLFSTIEQGGRFSFQGIARSTDQGLTWSGGKNGLTDNNVRAIAVSPRNNSIVLASSSSRIFRSNNAGITWQIVQENICCDIDEIRFNPVKKDEVWAVSGLEINRSTNAGITWTNVLSFQISEHTRLRFIQFDPLQKDRLFAGGNELMVSDDGGNSWHKYLQKGLLMPGGNALQVLSNYLVLATNNGLYRLDR